ncbi:hypothetical protein I3843_16G029900 [Carya illinoinensis]|nr:hypothetical protein I3843_16G029900 [Carya illinoinensis]
MTLKKRLKVAVCQTFIKESFCCTFNVLPTRYISQEDLRKHNKPGDVWISIQGKIYDVSDWLKDHPGGELPLLNFAGRDVTDAFYLDKFFSGYCLQDYSASEVSKDYRKLVSEFSKMGLFEKKGHGVFFALSLMTMLFVASVYGVSCSDSTWIMTTRKFNRFAQILTGNCLAGISIAWWKRNHNAHDIACKSLDFDPDLQHMPFFAVSSKFFKSITSYFYERKMNFDSATRFLVSYQHWTFYPVMCFARLNLFAQSFLLLFSKRSVLNRGQEILGLLVFWVWYPFLVSFLPNWGERMMFVVASFSITGIQHVQFCLNHFSSCVYVGLPTGSDWCEKQPMGTLDFQIEHHLFPRLPQCNLRKVSPFVKELCKKHGLPYNSVSVWEANVMTIGTLRTAALQARDLANPVPKNLVWEAVNTHG